MVDKLHKMKIKAEAFKQTGLKEVLLSIEDVLEIVKELEKYREGKEK
jgi:hypothetical protein